MESPENKIVQAPFPLFFFLDSIIPRFVLIISCNLEMLPQTNKQTTTFSPEAQPQIIISPNLFLPAKQGTPHKSCPRLGRNIAECVSQWEVDWGGPGAWLRPGNKNMYIKQGVWVQLAGDSRAEIDSSCQTSWLL